MSQPAPLSSAQSSAAEPASLRAKAMRPFVGLIDSVIVEAGGQFSFDGAIESTHAAAAWMWICRDLTPELVAPLLANPAASARDFEALLPEILPIARQALVDASKDFEAERRLKAQLGGEEGYSRLAGIIYALKSRPLLDKAQTFGRAVNGITEDSGLAQALQSMPLQDAKASALLMQAAIGQIVNPTRLVAAAVKIAAGASETAMARAGFGPLIDAILAHAQNQLPTLRPTGLYADMDLICRAIDRFHKLIRSISGYVEFGRGSRWSMVIAGLTKMASDSIEPKLQLVVPDVSQSLRRPREGTDRLDEDRLLSALNGVYLLVTLRDCRDSFALNAPFDQAWSQTGEALEAHLTRNLDAYRQNPADKLTQARLDAGIKMAELRFNADYAEVLRRARDAAGRRPA